MSGELDISDFINSCTVNIFCLHKYWGGQFEEYCKFAASSPAHPFDWIIIILYMDSFLQRICSIISREKNQNKK